MIPFEMASWATGRPDLKGKFKAPTIDVVFSEMQRRSGYDGCR